jgi:two-component system nitrogen regulation response regulator NtrX
VVERLILMTSEMRSCSRTEAVIPGAQFDSNEGHRSLRATGTLKDFKETAEKLFLVQKLKQNNWNIARTASKLKTPRSNLYKKLEQYKIAIKKEGIV